MATYLISKTLFKINLLNKKNAPKNIFWVLGKINSTTLFLGIIVQYQ